jgi:ribonuclease BN
MLERIKQLLKKLSYLNAKINPTILASSFAFYLLLTIIPFLVLVLNLLANLRLIEVKGNFNFGNNFINILIFIFNLLWSSSKLTNNLLVISDVIYYNVEYRPRLKLRITSIILTILFIFIGILMIIVGMYLGYLKTKILPSYTILLNIIQFICPFVFIALFIAIIYKYVIPVKITIKQTLKSSSIITSIIFILTILYQNIISKIMINKYINVYGSLASIITSLIWLYLNCYIFLVGIAILLFKDEYKENQKSI